MKPIFLGFTTIPIRRCPDILNVDIAHFVQITKKREECFENLTDVFCFFVFSVGFVGYLYIKVNAALAVLCKGFSGNDPVFGVDVLDGDSG